MLAPPSSPKVLPPVAHRYQTKGDGFRWIATAVDDCLVVSSFNKEVTAAAINLRERELNADGERRES